MRPYLLDCKVAIFDLWDDPEGLVVGVRGMINW